MPLGHCRTVRRTPTERDLKIALSVTGPFALVNLKPNTEYTTRLLARNRAGNSEYTSPLTVRTLPSANSGVTALFVGLCRRPTIVAAIALLAAAEL